LPYHCCLMEAKFKKTVHVTLTTSIAFNLPVWRSLQPFRRQDCGHRSWHVQFKLRCVIHSIFFGTCPAYLTNIVVSIGACWTRSGRRSASSTDFTQPRLRPKLGERAFSHAGLSAWNALPVYMRAVADPAEFRQQLKTHFEC